MRMSKLDDLADRNIRTMDRIIVKLTWFIWLMVFTAASFIFKLGLDIGRAACQG